MAVCPSGTEVVELNMEAGPRGRSGVAEAVGPEAEAEPRSAEMILSLSSWFAGASFPGAYGKQH